MPEVAPPMKPSEPMKPNPFASELAALPPEVAAELEDHLMESLAAGMRSGMTEEAARHAALRSLGLPLDIGRECEQAVAAGMALRGGWGWGLKLVAAGWLALGALFATRACQASDPTHGSIGSLGILTCACLASGVALRCWGARAAWPLTAWSWGMGAAAVLALVSTGLQRWLQGCMALSPALLAAVALFGVISGMFLAADRLQSLRRAASPAP